jgi:hypothetical protein
MKLFENPRQAFLLLGFLVLSAAFYVATYSNNTEFQADGSFTSYQPKSAQSFVQSIGVTTHLTYTSYKQNAYFSDVFGSVVKPKIRELGIYHVRQYPGETDSNFPPLVAKFNELTNPPSGYPAISINFETHISSTVSSNPQNECYMPKMKYILFGTLSNCHNLANYTAPSSVRAVSIENPNEPDHCASFVCNYSPSASNWYSYSLQQNPDWPDDVLNTAQVASTKLSADPQTASLERLAPSFVWLPYHQNETYNGTNLKTYLQPLKNYITHGNAHPYCNQSSVATCYAQQVQPVVDYYAPKPVVVTETGHSTAQFTETQQAKYLLRILFDFFERGIPRTYIYELLDEPTAATSTEQNFGLLNEDGREKPAFMWLKNTISLLKDSGSVTLRELSMIISGTNLRQTLLQKSDGSHWLALQYDKSNTTDADATTAATITFASPKNVEYYSPASTVAYKAESSITTLSISAPDKITLLRISDPVALNSGSNSSTTSNSTTNSTTKQSTTKNSGKANDQPNQTGQTETETDSTGFELKDNEIQLTKNLAVSKNLFATILIVALLFVTVVISWLRLRRELHQKKP